MSGVNGRQYIANLNAVPSSHDLALQQQESFNLDDELAKFTNTEFYDYDMAETVDATPMTYDAALEERARRENATAHRHNPEGVDCLDGGYQYQDFPGYQDMLIDEAVVAGSTLQPNTFAQGVPVNANTSSAANLVASQAPAQVNPIASLDVGQNSSLEDKSRLLAEEDKRRRNTAASARFRVKKKQREQTLERTVKEQTDKNNQLEAIINQLRMENKWLKNLVTEKNETKDDVVELWRKFNKDDTESRSTPMRKDGVGTANDQQS